MIPIDWAALVTGLASGSAMSTLYFAGLALGIRIAFQTRRAPAILLLSSALRITLLLAAGWVVAQAGIWAGGGYAISFLAVRFVATLIARPVPAEGDTWN